MSAPKSDTATIEARKNRLLELLAEGKSQVDAAEILRVEGYPADDRTIRRDVRLLRGQWSETNMNQFDAMREQQLREVEEDKADLKSLRDKLTAFVDPREVIEWALKIIDRRDSIRQTEIKLTGTAAPSKSIVGHVHGPQLDAFYLEIRQELIDLSDGDKQEALVLMREFAKSRKKPVVVDAMPLRPVERSLTDGNILTTSD